MGMRGVGFEIPSHTTPPPRWRAGTPPVAWPQEIKLVVDPQMACAFDTRVPWRWASWRVELGEGEGHRRRRTPRLQTTTEDHGERRRWRWRVSKETPHPPHSAPESPWWSWSDSSLPSLDGGSGTVSTRFSPPPPPPPSLVQGGGHPGGGGEKYLCGDRPPSRRSRGSCGGGCEGREWGGADPRRKRESASHAP